MNLALSVPIFAVLAVLAAGFALMTFALPVGAVLHVLKVPDERQALGVGFLVAPPAAFLYWDLLGSFATVNGFRAAPVVVGLLAGWLGFIIVHLRTPRLQRQKFVDPVRDWWRENAADAERARERAARAEAARKAADAAPTINVGQYATKRWWVRVSGGRFSGERKFDTEAAALAFVERVKKKGGRRVEGRG